MNKLDTNSNSLCITPYLLFNKLHVKKNPFVLYLYYLFIFRTWDERLREDQLKLSTLNEKYLETISELQNTLQKVRVAPTAPPDRHRTENEFT